MSKFNDAITRIKGSIAAVDYATSPKDISQFLARSITKLPAAMTGKLNAERQIISDLAKDIPDKYKKAQFNSIADFNAAFEELKNAARLQMQNFLELASKLEAEVAANDGVTRSVRSVLLDFGNDIKLATANICKEYLEGAYAPDALSGASSFMETLGLHMAEYGVEDFNSNHVHYGVVARAIKKAVTSRFAAPKAMREAKAPREKKSKKAS